MVNASTEGKDARGVRQGGRREGAQPNGAQWCAPAPPPKPKKPPRTACPQGRAVQNNPTLNTRKKKARHCAPMGEHRTAAHLPHTPRGITRRRATFTITA